MRLTWSPDGRCLLVCDRGALRIIGLDGAVIKEIDPRTIVLGTAPREGEPGRRALATFLDARWLRDGRIAALDCFGLPIQFTMHGAPYGEPTSPANPWLVDCGAIGEGDHVAVIRDNVRVSGRDQKQRWELLRTSGIGKRVQIRHVELSHDGTKLALGTTQDGLERDRDDVVESPRFAWWVLDITKRHGEANATVLGHGLGQTTSFAFDRGDRLLIAARTWAGAVRLDGARSKVSGAPARCIALDDRGVRAVYGDDTSELRIEYLSPNRKGAIEVLDDQRIDVGLVPVALALAAEGTQIACLDADGHVEIAPVP